MTGSQISIALQNEIKKYLERANINGVIVGISGGIDSGVAASLAVYALGSENVLGITMPSKYTSNETLTDAKRLAEKLKIQLKEIPIHSLHERFKEQIYPTLPKNIQDDPEQITDQNVQARIRMIILMTFANAMKRILLCCGNKTEIAVGYGTLYADTAGGIAPIGDLYKYQVYEIAKCINHEYGDIIPDSMITRIPTAELRPNQEDRQSIPDYPILDPILQELENGEAGVKTLIQKGYASETIKQVQALVKQAEYKRIQYPYIPKIK